MMSYTMKIFSFILSSLSVYMSLGAIFSLLSFQWTPILGKKRKEKDNKRQGNKIPYITIPTFKALLPSKTQNTWIKFLAC